MSGFTQEQLEAMQAPLSLSNVASRKQSGRSLDYIEGWFAEAEANRIFGYDGWDSETVYERCVAERERKLGSSGDPGWGVSYIAKVRVTVRAGSVTVVREGVGSGHGIDRDLGLAHESAIKEAATDAEKRALKTFGNPFGLALYDKSRANVVNDEAPPPSKSAYQAKKEGLGPRANELIHALRDLETHSDVGLWVKDHAEEIKGFPDNWRAQIREEVEEQRRRISEKEMDDGFRGAVGS